jgi:hypothetical protein
MATGIGKKRDFTQIAKAVIDKATGNNEAIAIIEETTTSISKNPHAQALSALGASKGGKARAKKLSTKRKREVARKAARARWEKA